MMKHPVPPSIFVGADVTSVARFCKATHWWNYAILNVEIIKWKIVFPNSPAKQVCYTALTSTNSLLGHGDDRDRCPLLMTRMPVSLPATYRDTGNNRTGRVSVGSAAAVAKVVCILLGRA